MNHEEIHQASNMRRNDFQGNFGCEQEGKQGSATLPRAQVGRIPGRGQAACSCNQKGLAVCQRRCFLGKL